MYDGDCSDYVEKIIIQSCFKSNFCIVIGQLSFNPYQNTNRKIKFLKILRTCNSVNFKNNVSFHSKTKFLDTSTLDFCIKFFELDITSISIRILLNYSRPLGCILFKDDHSDNFYYFVFFRMDSSTQISIFQNKMTIKLSQLRFILL